MGEKGAHELAQPRRQEVVGGEAQHEDGEKTAEGGLGGGMEDELPAPGTEAIAGQRRQGGERHQAVVGASQRGDESGEVHPVEGDDEKERGEEEP